MKLNIFTPASIFCFPFFLVYGTSFSQKIEVPFPCNIKVVDETNINIDSLNYDQVELFLQTFDSTCKNNVEFSEYSNEVLFKLLTIRTILIVKVLSTSKNIDLQIIFAEIENPVIEFDFQPIFLKLNSISGFNTTIAKLKKCIRIAASKSNQILKE